MISKWRLEENEELRAAIERKAFERGLRVLGFGATPFGGPFSFRNKQTVFTVLFLPHLPLPLRASNSAIRAPPPSTPTQNPDEVRS